MLGQQDYPAAVKTLLWKLLVATCLLTVTLKFIDEITGQLQGYGSLRHVMINGLARLYGDIAYGVYPGTDGGQRLSNDYAYARRGRAFQEFLGLEGGPA